jgi:hypothetical protein
MEKAYRYIFTDMPFPTWLVGMLLQADTKAHPMAVFALRPNRSPVGLNNRLGDGKTQPVATAVLRAGFVTLIKALKDVRQILGRDALPGIIDVNDAFFSLGFERYGDLPAGRGVTECVVQ